ncbi:hypothetical protein E0Z10_g6558 [Xylaria hypoxylon]|uniref:Uncharacterized protein n=1 Tax=Xylaria hypoxylon TaxID=37992 RepID=A0A4Z0YUX6_9PEZI|nr:hypothetical protein E0Z10_g6558 [Xylaria hypoxylon]
MEAVGTASAIITFIEVSHKLLVACYRLRGQWRDYEKDISGLISEVERLSDISEELREIVNEADGQKTLSQLPPPPTTTSKTGGSALTACRSALEACTSVLEELSNDLTPLTRARFRDKLKWPFESGNVAKKVEFIQTQKSTLELALSTYQTRLLATHSRKTDDRYLKKKREKLLRWFKTSDPEQNHIVSRESHEPGTGQWIFENESFKRWANDAGGLLWLHGIPGAGKTILCSTVIAHLQARSSSPPRGSGSVLDHILYYYFTFSDDSKQSLTNLLKFIIYQLIAHNQEISEAAASLYDSKSQGSNEPSVKELIDTLAAVASLCTGKVYLLVDALDECPRKERKTFYEKALGPILAAKVNLMIASRGEPDIENALRNISPYEICIQNDDVNADVRAHVNSVISQDPKFQVMQISIQAEILDGIVSGARGMFRWAVCQLEVIKECLTPAMVRERLKTMPVDLDQTYDRILHIIPDLHRPFVQSALHWLAFSTRPLLLKELAEAAVVQPGETFDPDSSRLLSQNMIVDLCGVLVSSSITHDRLPGWLDSKFETERRPWPYKQQKHVVIALSHYSVKEYLTSKSIQCGALSSFYTSVTLCNSYLAQCCLTYILGFNGGAFARVFNFDEYPLLEYACRHWVTHWENASTGDEEPLLRSLVEHMFQLDAPEAYANWLNIFNPDGGRRDLHQLTKSVDLYPQTLYWATYLGHMALVRLLVEKGADVNKAEGSHGSAFRAAAFRGHLGIVNFFLQRGANLSSDALRAGSVLRIAVVGGNYEVVRCLIERGADIDAGGGSYGTPLIAAINKQHHDMVDLLISRGANIRAAFTCLGIYAVPLYHAASTGDFSLVNKLLEAGADVNDSGDSNLRSPLYGAVKSESITIVKALVEKGAVIDPDSFLEAVNIGHVGMVQTLLEADADHNLLNRMLQAALEESIRKHHTAIFHALIDADTRNNKLGAKFERLLGTALSSREFDMARTLMERGLVDYDAYAVVAATRIHKSEPYFLEELLQNNDIDINAVHSFGVGYRFYSPLHIAIRNEDEEAIWAILHRDPDVNMIEMAYGWTPLPLAIVYGLSDIAKELIRRGAAVRKVRWSPLEMAVKHACVSKDGSLDMINRLLDLGVKANVGEGSALWWPLEMGQYSIIEHLWVYHTMRPVQQATTMMGKPLTPILYAAMKGDLKMVKFLLNLGADLNGPSGNEGPTLVDGLRSNNKIIVEFLLDNGAILEQEDGSSALHLAITRGFQDLVPKLLNHGADVNANEKGESPLAAAFRAKDDILIAMLRNFGAQFSLSDDKILTESIEHGTIEDMKKLFHFGLSPDVSSDVSEYRKCGIWMAISKGNHEALELLIEKGVNISGDRHQRILNDVCGSGDIKVAKVLLDNSDDLEPSSALVQAVGVVNNYKIVKMLLERGATVNGTCFENAIDAGMEMITRLLDIPITASQRSEYLGRALQSAAFRGHLSICNWLIDNCGADVNYRGPPYGTTLQALLRHWEGNSGNEIIIIEMLLSRGANINPAPVDIEPEGGDSIGQEKTAITLAPPISQALERPYFETMKALVRILLAYGANINLIGGQYHAALQTAAYFCPSMLKDVLDAGADVNAAGGELGTALHAIAMQHDADAVKLLLSRGADVRIISGKYGSVLHSAAHGQPLLEPCPRAVTKTMDLLLEAGADVNTQCGIYGSAVQAAAVGRNLEALKWLVANGADIRVRGGKWGNVYRAACSSIRQGHIISWLEFHYGRDGWEDDTKD